MMKITLEEMLAESTAAPDAGRAARRRTIFLEYWGQMEEARRKGWSWLQIHNALFREGIVDYPYPTFMYYKDRRLKRKPTETKPDAGSRNANDAKPTPSVERSSRPLGFSSGKAELPTFKDVTRERGDKWF